MKEKREELREREYALEKDPGGKKGREGKKDVKI